MKKVRFQDQVIPVTASSFTQTNEPAKKMYYFCHLLNI